MTKKNNKDKTVSVIIPNFNGEELLRANLPRVLTAAENKKNRIVETIVVDDASMDKSVAILKKQFPQVRLIKHKVNRGFSAAVNIGARSAKGSFLALLNTDVIPSNNFLEPVLPHFDKEDVFAVSLHEKNYGWARGFFKKGFVVHEPGLASKKTRETFWVNGGSGVFRRSFWMKLQGMDEKLLSPFYWEDTDLSYRAQKRGWKVLWEPKAKVVHWHASTISKFPKRFREKIQERNQLIFIWKNITSPILFRKHIVGLLARVSRHPGYLRIVIMALMKIRIIKKARKKEKKESKVSDEAIFARFS
jgi:GT2 family glycosyltransferase